MFLAEETKWKNRKSLTDFCVVLDIDQTLVATQEDKNMSRILDPKSHEHMDLRPRVYALTLVEYKKGKKKLYNFWGITRPHYQEFLSFCFRYFKVVVVWSAGEKDYVHELCKFLFRHTQAPDAILSRDDCGEDNKGNLIKPLKKLFDHPILGKYMHTDNTIIVDDNELTFAQNLDNAVYIPKYDPSFNYESFKMPDHDLLTIKFWLMALKVIGVKNIRNFDKTGLFKEKNYKDFIELLRRELKDEDYYEIF